jgi:hypothetical protein
MAVTCLAPLPAAVDAAPAVEPLSLLSDFSDFEVRAGSEAPADDVDGEADDELEAPEAPEGDADGEPAPDVDEVVPVSDFDVS